MSEPKTETKNAVVKKIPQLVTDAVADGKVVFYGEFRRGTAVEFSGKGGKVFHQSKCTIENDAGAILVTEFLPDGVDWKTWQAPYQKGQMVYVVCRGLEESSGAQVASGKIILAQ